MKSLSILIFFFCLKVYAADFEPYKNTKISPIEWTKYFEQIETEYGDSARRHDSENSIYFTDQERATIYQFTTIRHPAHPSWITSEIKMIEGRPKVNQIGYFAGSEKEFREMYESIRQLHQTSEENMNRQRE